MKTLAAGLLLFALVPLLIAEDSVRVEGWVIDSSCAFTKNLEKPISSKCARDCARSGSPLVILTDDGTVYWPISGTMPASGENKKLLPFAGKRVTAQGKVYQRSGSRAIVLERIQAAKTGN